ncbi:protein HEAT-STRESS-ASSOCIATED 32-like isoform X2 [Euphorbia lathyris]|uniref:protein HEAT-STRESS-ASSOCIATED 32-like isoform X2 n=1 Tax=Euphorbia lathyris TaxID=212925 RepID=UPI00331355D3
MLQLLLIQPNTYMIDRVEGRIRIITLGTFTVMAEYQHIGRADMIMIDADDICRDADSLRAEVIAKFIGRLGLEKTMFESSSARTAEWFVKCYGPRDKQTSQR